MAVTTEVSTQLTNVAAGKKLQTPVDLGSMYIIFFDFTQGAAAGDIGSTVGVGDLPAGRWHFIGDLSQLHCDAFGAARTLDFGWAAYIDGADNITTVVADDNGLDDDVDVSAALAAGSKLGTALAAGTGRRKLFNVGVGGVRLFFTVAGGTIPAATKINGHLTFVKV